LTYSKSVTAPRDALLTAFEYLARAPRRAYNFGAFQRLRRGGAANNYTVEAVVFAGGKMFAGDKATEPQPYKILAFNQR